MRKFAVIVVGVGALVFACAPPAVAKRAQTSGSAILTEASAATFVAALKRMGYGHVELTKNDNDDPQIDSVDGIAHLSVSFADCDPDPDHCQVIKVAQCWNLQDDAMPGRVWLWNKWALWAVAYLDQSKSPCMAMEINFTGGITSANFASLMNRWQLAADDFKNSLPLKK
jgi:hypothetical protein